MKTIPETMHRAGKILFRPRLGLLLMVAALAAAARWPAASVSVLRVWSFTGNADGGGSGAPLLIDQAGNTFGTSYTGGANNLGTVFQLVKLSNNFTAVPIWTFTGGSDGAMPLGGLIEDSSGALYGTASAGGGGEAGTVFKLSPPASGGTTWTFTTLYTFTHGTDGGSPTAGLIADNAGNLYGTTGSYGTYRFGTVFELSPPANGQTAWTETTLWDFTGGTDGGNPLGSLLIDASGNVYGTASRGGTDIPYGIAFELSPPAQSGDAWTETVLFNFTGANGGHPASALVADSHGDLYGTTAFGGQYQKGTAFELSPPTSKGGEWTQSTIWNFSANAGGIYPFSALVGDAAGKLYGTTYGYSPTTISNESSTIFVLTPPASGSTAWTATTLATMQKGNGIDLLSALAADSSGTLWGTSISGGNSQVGTIFRVKGTGFVPSRRLPR